MGDTVERFNAEIDERALGQLRGYAEATGRSLASVLTEVDYLARARLRPELLEAADEIIEEHAELLDRLAQ